MANLPSVPANATKPVNPHVSQQQLKKADDDVGKWFMGLLDGSGTRLSEDYCDCCFRLCPCSRSINLT